MSYHDSGDDRQTPDISQPCHKAGGDGGWSVVVPRTIGMHLLARAVAALGLTLSASGTACANGFFIPQQSVTGIGRAFAGSVAQPVDASTIFTNPAGMTELRGAQTTVGASVITSFINFKNKDSTAATPGTGGAELPYPGGSGGNPGSPTLVPSLYGAAPIADGRIWLGVGLSAPFGQALKYNKDWFGRYDSIESQLRTINLTPALAVRVIDQISVGAGLDVQYADAKLTNALPDPLAVGGPSPATDGRAKLDGNDVSYGFNVGLLVKPVPGTRIGLHYRSAITHDLNGHLEISGLTGPLAAGNGRSPTSTRLNLPDVLSLGLAQEVGDRLTLLTQFQWFGWNRFKELEIHFKNDQQNTSLVQGFRDSWMVSAGAEYALTDRWTLRGGVQFDRTPTVDSHRNTSLPDGNRVWFGLGASYQLKGGLRLDIGALHVMFEDGTVDLTRQFYQGTPAESEVRVRGRAKTHVDTLAVGLLWRF
jgi:long-chain fatty acid transport protein